MIGKKVKIINSKSIPNDFLGEEGRITGKYGDKWVILIKNRRKLIGSLSHTAIESDFKIIKD